MAQEKLRDIDQIAYIRFASVYREFADLSEFQAEVAKALRPDVAKTVSRARARKALVKPK